MIPFSTYSVHGTTHDATDIRTQEKREKFFHLNIHSQNNILIHASVCVWLIMLLCLCDTDVAKKWVYFINPWYLYFVPRSLSRIKATYVLLVQINY